MEYLFNNKKSKKRYVSNNDPEPVDKSINQILQSKCIYNYIDVYYLLYKLKNSKDLWIVKINQDLDILLMNHQNINNTENENYIVVKKFEKNNFNYLKITGFNQFIKDNNCTIIYYF